MPSILLLAMLTFCNASTSVSCVILTPGTHSVLAPAAVSLAHSFCAYCLGAAGQVNTGCKVIRSGRYVL